MQDPGFQKKNRKWYQKLFTPRNKSHPSNLQKNKIDTCVRLAIRPLRIFQFLVVLLIFVLIIYTIMLANPMLSSVMCILLIVLSGVYLFVLSMDLINQFMGDKPQTTPIFIFSFVGSLLFGAAGIFLIAVHAFTAPWFILTIAFISLFASILFIIDVSLIIACWKRNSNICQQCRHSKDTNIIQRKHICHPLCTETTKRDLTTSVSSVKVPSGDEGATLDHGYRKTREAHRRQYVDCPTSARVLNLTDAADIQTEMHGTVNAQIQTQQEMKEAPVQTVSKCELCNRQIQIFPSSGGTVQSANQQDCSPCPALVKLLSGTPCCPGCRCVTGIIQVSQQSQQRQTQRQKQSNEQMEPTKDGVQLKNKKLGDTLTSDKHHPQDPNVTGTVTKITLASYSLPSKKAHTSCQTNTGETTETTPTKDTKSDEQQPAERPKTNSTDKEHGKSDARKRHDTSNDKARKRTAENATKNVNKPSARKVSETVAEKPMENTEHVTTELSQASTSKQVAELSAEKPMESSEKGLAGNSDDNPVESSKENVPGNIIFAKKPGEAIKIGASESSTDELNRVSKNPKSSSAARKLKFRSKKENFSSAISSEGHNVKTSVTGSKKISSLPGPPTLVVRRPKEASKDGVVGKESNDDHSERKRVTNVKPNSRDKKMPTSTYSMSTLRVHSVESSEDTTSNGASAVALVSSKKTVDSGRVSDDGSKNDTARSDLSTATRTERSQETEAIYKPNTETQTTVDPRRKKTYAFKRKNKVQPGGTTYAEIDVQTSGSADTNVSRNKSQDEALIPKKLSAVDNDALNICPSCKRMQMPATSSSFQYYDMHRDKQGRIYCKYCAPPNSVLHKKDYQTHLKCTGCGQPILEQSSQSDQGTSNGCPNCGQLQVRVQ